MTTALEAPATQHTGDGHPTHWCCITQDGIPFLSLCGDLPVNQQRTSAARINCRKCLDLVEEHTAACGPCRPYAGQVRR